MDPVNCEKIINKGLTSMCSIRSLVSQKKSTEKKRRVYFLWGLVPKNAFLNIFFPFTSKKLKWLKLRTKPLFLCFWGQRTQLWDYFDDLGSN